jgi:hypothetical protein
MGDPSFELEARISALETRVLSLPALSRFGAQGDTDGCTNCNTNGCTNCVGHELMNVLLPGEDRALSGREIVRMLHEVRERR